MSSPCNQVGTWEVRPLRFLKTNVEATYLSNSVSSY